MSVLTAASELPATSWPDVPLWTENYCFVCFDPATEIGVWTHLGRAPFDPTLWRELSMVYLPSGERLVHKGYGRGERPDGPGGATLAFACVEPFAHWHTSRDGGAIRTTVDELFAGTVADRRHERLRFDLDWRPAGPVWDWGEVDDEHQWGKSHYEQLCRVDGSLTIAGEEVAFTGTGIRDHTSGPRDFTVFSKHIWSWATFPSGRGFILLQLIVGGRRVERAVVFEDGELEHCDLETTGLLDDRAGHLEAYAIRLGEHRISARILHPLPNGFDGPNDICLGYDPAITATANFESFSAFEWDGETGHGLTERSIRLG